MATPKELLDPNPQTRLRAIFTLLGQMPSQRTVEGRIVYLAYQLAKSSPDERHIKRAWGQVGLANADKADRIAQGLEEA